MTYKEWEFDLRRKLKSLPKSEIDDVLKFYREIYNDKRDAGISERDIILEFGSPRECASKILGEDASEDCKRVYNPDIRYEDKRKEKTTRVTGSDVSKVIGLVLLTIIIYIPLFCAFFGLLVGFAATFIGGCAAAIGGVGGTLLGIFGIFSTGLSYGLMVIGMGLGLTGAGIFLAIVFFYATKYCGIGLFKAVKALIFK